MKKYNSYNGLRKLMENLTGPIPVSRSKKIFRNEYKFMLNQYEFQKCLNICRKYMKYDEYCGEDGFYFINSLYFDSVGSRDYFSKELGDYDRKKMRIRNYGHNLEWANFEMKRKIDIWEYKDKVRLDKEQVNKITKGDFSPLLDIGDETAVNFYAVLKEGVYRPSCIVEYFRTAFLMPFEDIRITFDVDVSYSVSEFDLFKQKVTTPLFPDGHVVFEIKYNDFLPGWAKKMMNSMKMSNEAVSKYCLAKRNYL